PGRPIDLRSGLADSVRGGEYAGAAMWITKVETIQLREHPRLLWVHLHSDGGLVGLGETYYAPSVVAAAIHDYFGPLLIGRDPSTIERHWEAMFRMSDHAGYGGAEMRAISALDMALWDIKGQALGVPVYELLGGRAEEHTSELQSRGHLVCRLLLRK